MQKTVVEQTQKNLMNLPVLYKQDNSQIIQYNPIQEAIELWANISDNKTGEIYRQAASKTWDIFKQAVAIIFFLCKLLIASIIWISGLAFQTGQIFRNKLEVEQPTLDQIISYLFQFLLWPFARAYDWAASFIKKYLGWDKPLTAKSSAIEPQQMSNSGVTSIESSSTK
ncbi:hypothetical protein G7B40_035250 [Aetokthonos hydrillicola Thurmond2011]|jgi:hypothetical protein|uniref:Uncharacterized protein n=1 Tax=Aetokthonos hydrillicola Thurmond2011 TaxID=2712845 RepID=A0AAP5MCY9_9CYAN|nr:hypothetical protein [Aetokthonos hydrillicola]MBO3460121.1 hypothetical protein [Aetokthonos hydrillicola CCALA 1050]MBW4590727.1 hypothetical protein [Aetokthonos hydrillicola CCALA 1050]MDR9899777.1 hypothetical protein [Aetokthonos hydrillicola Thurmond2011]